ncbi:MAG: Uma2 family endonuclease [Acidobacteria bacterium]|nr:Uma2 family endonuclease [Acidobacteriota bacterium]
MAVAERDLKKKITYDEYLAMPETNLRYEIVDGEMIMSLAPTSEHQWFLTNLLDALRSYVKRKKLGVVLPAPVDVMIRKAPLKTRQPDILFLNAERTGVKGRDQLREMPIIEAPPDLVIEVLSPSDGRVTLKNKLQDYNKIGVRECWLVSSEAETVEILKLSPDGAKRIRLFGAGDTLRSEILPGFKMKVDDIFA